MGRPLPKGKCLYYKMYIINDTLFNDWTYVVMPFANQRFAYSINAIHTAYMLGYGVLPLPKGA